MSARLDIDALRALVAVADRGGVTRASEELALSQSAVSHKIKRLEAALGCDLLTRRSGAALLTDSGERLLRYARRITGLHEEALQALSANGLKGNIRLGMTEDTTSTGLSRILGRFARLHPDVAVRTHVSQSLQLARELDEGTIDIAIMQVFRSEVRADDAVLYNDQLHWVKAHDLSLNRSRAVPYLAFDGNCFYRQWAFDNSEAMGVNFSMVLECPSAAGISSAIEAGLGVALLNARLITPNMQIVDDDFVKPPPLSYVVRRAERARTAPAKALFKEIANETAFDASLRVA